jgi:hypothetical protein
MKVKNFWLQKRRERNLLKIVEWAQKAGRKVESLTREEAIEAMRSQR